VISFLAAIIKWVGGAAIKFNPMPIEDRDWYRAEYREREAAKQRQARRKLWLVRATIGVLFVIVFALAAPLLGNVVTNMRCNRGFPLIIIQVGGGCPGGGVIM
jgi:hypothetical protein